MFDGTIVARGEPPGRVAAGARSPHTALGYDLGVVRPQPINSAQAIMPRLARGRDQGGHAVAQLSARAVATAPDPVPTTHPRSGQALRLTPRVCLAAARPHLRGGGAADALERPQVDQYVDQAVLVDDGPTPVQLRP